jgi:hypothetical protein
MRYMRNKAHNLIELNLIFNHCFLALMTPFKRSFHLNCESNWIEPPQSGVFILTAWEKKVSTYLDPRILRSIFLPAWPPCSLKDRRHGEGGGAGENDQGLGHGWLFYRRKLSIRRPKINYSYVIHLTS